MGAKYTASVVHQDVGSLIPFDVSLIPRPTLFIILLLLLTTTQYESSMH